MEHKLEERDQKTNDPGYQLSADGLTLLKVTEVALGGNDHFTIPDSVTSIENGAFYDCTSLTTVHIPGSVTEIGHEAFGYCTTLTTVCIPEGVTSIGGYAFRGCTSLTTVHIPEGVTSIGYGAFEGCSSLTTVHIPEGVTSIENGAFRRCTRLTTVNIPNSVTSIGVGAFYACTSLTYIIIDTDNETELNRIKTLLPENLRKKVISSSVYEILRNIVGNFFDHALSKAGLPVTNVNQIITSYLPEAADRILEIINTVDNPVFLPNDESKITYRELLAQSIGGFFPNFNAIHATDQKQHADTKQFDPNTDSTLRLTLTPPASQEDQLDSTQEASSLPRRVDEKENPTQDQQGSTPPTPGLFQSVAQTTGAPQADAQPVVPTRGQRVEEKTQVCCVMQ